VAGDLGPGMVRSDPGLPGESEAVRHEHLVAAGVSGDAVSFIAEPSGDALRGVVVLEDLGPGRLRLEYVERQGQEADAGFRSVRARSSAVPSAHGVRNGRSEGW
jgi:hypothetical protein